jgi:hypothetical protein
MRKLALLLLTLSVCLCDASALAAPPVITIGSNSVVSIGD